MTENGLWDGKDAEGTFDPGDDSDAPPDSPETGGPAEECNGVDDDGDGEVDEGFADFDEDGLADCVDRECPTLERHDSETLTPLDECREPPVVDPWNVRVKWSFAAPSAAPDAQWSITTPVVGYLTDTNGDGEVGTGDRPSAVFETYAYGLDCHLVAVDATTGAEQWDYWPVSASYGVAIADVDADGFPEVVALDHAYRPMALDGGGNLEWTADEAIDDASVPAIGDLDGDGAPEIVVDTLVLEGATGALQTRLDAVSILSDWAREPVLADIDADGDLEILLSGVAFDSDGVRLWDAPALGTSDHGWARVIQADADDEGEILWSNGQLTDHLGASLAQAATEVEGDQPCLGDLDADGAVEAAVSGSGGVWSFDARLATHWVNDLELGQNGGCVTYDLDRDGAAEVLLSAFGSFAIFDGRTGEVHWQETGDNGVHGPYIHPTVADVDQDGHAEIFAVTDYYDGLPRLLAYEHAGEGWSATGPTWPVNHYATGTIEDDGSVPSAPTPWWLVDGIEKGRAAWYPDVADLTVTIDDYCTADCLLGPVQISVRVTNVGLADVPAGVTLALYTNDDVPRLLATRVLEAIPRGTSLPSVVFDVPLEDVSATGVRAVVDDDGTGSGTVTECDEGDNADTWTDVDCL